MQEEEKNIIPIPNMNVTINDSEEVVPEIATSNQIISVCEEILTDIRENTKEIDETLKSFTEMVMNEGDATTSSKEAVVNLLKLKAEQSDKKTKIADILVNAFLKQKYTQPKIFSAHQHNEFNIEDGSKKRKFLKGILNEDKCN